MQSTPSTAAETARSAIILFLSGLSILLGLVLITYAITIILDRCCFCCPGFLPLHNNEPRVIEGGIIARDAGLIGLTKKERRKILEWILKIKLYASTRTYQEQSSRSNTDTISASRENIGAPTDREDPEQLPPEVVRNDDLIDGNGVTCAICLNDYEKEDNIIEGNHCSHMFHKDCLLQWLEKRDICPCCRENMMTSDEMKEAAKCVLSSDRVTQLAMGYGYRRNEDDDNTDVDVEVDMDDEREEGSRIDNSSSNTLQGSEG